ncbi:MAG: T9SS type A sorting domain-containing protein [Bacteroidia bacterium]|nr:T9SS type A sorting domain-containing protein [Bacteroidia bacterium]
MKKLLQLAVALCTTTTAFSQSWKALYTSDKTATNVVLAEGKNNEIFVGFLDKYSGKPGVKKLVGNTWVSVGDSLFGYWAGNMRMAIKKDGHPVIAFQDINKNFQLTVMQYNGTTWDTLGRRGFTGLTSTGDVGLTVVDTQICVAFQQFNQIKAWKSNGTNAWTEVGPGGVISTGFPSNVNLSTNGNRLYVSYRDNSGKHYVRYSDNLFNFFTLKSSFGSGASSSVQTVVLPGNVEFSSCINSSGTLQSFYYYVNWSNTSNLPNNLAPLSVSSFSLGLNDSMPVIVAKDNKNKCRFYRANLIKNTWDSVGSSYVTQSEINDKVHVLTTSNKDIYIGYHDALSGGKLVIVKLCESIGNLKISTLDPIPAKLCIGSSKRLSASVVATKYQWLLDGTPIQGGNSRMYTATQAGSYMVKAHNGCGDSNSSVTYSLVAGTSPKPVISQNGAKLVTTDYLAYQWLLNGQEISGATAKEYTPTEGGTYAVKTFSADSCIVLSDAYTYWPAIISNVENGIMQVYPNPAKDHLQIVGMGKLQVGIYDAAGRRLGTFELQENTPIDISNLPKGLLFVKALGHSKTYTIIHE